MLVESLLAVAALITAVVLSSSEYGKTAGNPIGLFSSSAARITESIGLPVRLGTLFMSLSVAAFAMTSLDTATRLGRYAIQELFEAPDPSPTRRALSNRYLATGITVAVAALLVFSGSATEIWPIFGAANQLVAALAFLTISLWLVFIRRPSLFALIPGVFIYAVTMAALGWNIYEFSRKEKFTLVIISVFLMTLALILGVTGVRSLSRAYRSKASP